MRHPRARAFQSESTQRLSAKFWLSLMLIAVVGVAIAAVSVTTSAESKGPDASRVTSEGQSKRLGRGARDRSAQKRTDNRSTSGFISPLLVTVTVDTTADVAALSLCTAAPADCSLRGAVEFANANPGTTISVPAGTYTLVIPGGFPEGFNGDNLIGDLDFKADNTAVIGAGAATTIINQTASDDRVIEVNPFLDPDFDFSISGVTISGGNEATGVGGGGIISGSIGNTATVTNCTFSGNSATGIGGGGIAHQGGSLTVTGSTFSSNSTSTSGGAINYSAGDPFGRTPSTGSLIVSGSTFTSNTANSAAAGGGALDLYNFNGGVGSYSVSTSSFSSNTAPSGSGGAIIVESGPLTMTLSSLTNNSAGSSGGAVFSTTSTTITYSRLVGNTVSVPTNGLTLFRQGGTMTAEDTWWGRNSGPAANDFRALGGISVTPTTWLQLRHSASPNTICVGGSSTLSADILGRNVGAALTTELNGLPTFPATFINATPALGTVTGATNFVNGQATATFTATNAGTAMIDVTADNETVTATVIVDTNATTDPADQLVCEGDTATFTTTATGPGTITFVWKKGATVLNDGDLGGRVSGATTNSLSISNVQASDADTYTVEATGSCNTATQSATLTVNEDTTATDPADATVCEGDIANFSTTATGTNLTFAWTVDGSPAGGNSPTLNVDTTGFSAGAHPVTLTVTGACGVVNHSATLTVNADTTATDPADQTVCEGDTANFSTTASGTNISYAWTVDGNSAGGNSPNLAVDTTGFSAGAHPVTLTVTGECGVVNHSATLTVNANTTATDPADQTVCEGDTATFSTTAAGSNLTFAWTVDGSPAGGNSATLNVDTTGFTAGAHPVTLTVTGDCGVVNHSATLTVNANTTATDPADATVCQGAMANFSTTASGTNISYAWTLDGNSTGSNSPNLAVDTTSLSPGSHTVGLTVTGTCGVVNHTANLTVDAPTATTDPADQSVCQGGTATFTTTASGTGPFTFVWKKGAMVLVDGDFGGRVDITSTATTSTLTITNAQPTDAGAYSVETTGGGTCTNTAIQTANLAVDSGPPVITTNGQTLTLWPPNHHYSTFTVNQFVTGASDGCDPNVDINDVVIASVTSDELEENPSGADGNTVDDIVIAANCKSVQLRAERDGNLDGRIYTITFKVTDSQGNVGTATAKVQVPKNNNGTAVDSGVKYTETGVCP